MIMITEHSRLGGNLSNNDSSNEPYASDENSLDPLSRHLLKLDLRKGLPDKYDGNPSTFWAWYMEINGYIVESRATPTEIIYILKANTIKKPRELIETFLSGGFSVGQKQDTTPHCF